MLACFTEDTDASVPVLLVLEKTFDVWLKNQSDEVYNWILNTKFSASSGSVCMIPNADGSIARILLGVADDQDWWAAGTLPVKLPAGSYILTGDTHGLSPEQLAVAFGLGAYQFSVYKKQPAIEAVWVLEGPLNKGAVNNMVSSIYLLRDCINTPTEDFTPADFAEIVTAECEALGAHVSQIVGDELLADNYPLVHAVGRAGSSEPRLVDVRWGDPSHKSVTLVGKGVCYDTGGLSLKPSNGMVSMKKDMGGAAHVFALARLIMLHNLPVHLRLLIPMVENNVSANSIRPGDIVIARNGKSVEITNTDAEGRLILADALVAASEEQPDLLIDMATLTGAARVAVGPDLPAFMTEDEPLMQDILAAGLQAGEPVWPLPMYAGYKRYLHSDIADCDNAGSKGMAGASVAGLFLREFVGDDIPWVHWDVHATRPKTLPGRPKGGDATGLLAVWQLIQNRI